MKPQTKITQYVKKTIKAHPKLLKVARKIKPIKTGPLRFYNLPEAFEMTLELSKKIPNQYDAIVGVPRAGLLIANVLASTFGRPLSTPDAFVKGEVWFSGLATKPSSFKKILVVEDSIASGGSLHRACDKIHDSNPDAQIDTVSLFVEWSNSGQVNYYHTLKDAPNLYEWNIMCDTHCYGPVVSDLDGVFCRNCTDAENDDGARYLNFIKTAEPKLIPTYSIDAIVTTRLEKYRSETADWLKRNNVKYKELYMRRDNKESAVELKSSVYEKSHAFWMWESDISQAIEIHKRTEKPVLCIDEMVLINKHSY